MKIKRGPSDIFFPVPAALVVSGSFEKPNIITVAWLGMMSAEPPIIAVSLRDSRYSSELIKKSGEFTVNIPSANHFKEVDYCGLVSGRKRNKFDDINFTPLKSSIIEAPIIKECPYNMECELVDKVDLKGGAIILGEIVETHVDEDKINSSSNKIDIAKVDPLVYCARIREYWKLGSKLGNGFEAGKEILHKLEK